MGDVDWKIAELWTRILRAGAVHPPCVRMRSCGSLDRVVARGCI
jgi:hypothetical protein